MKNTKPDLTSVPISSKLTEGEIKIYTKFTNALFNKDLDTIKTLLKHLPDKIFSQDHNHYCVEYACVNAEVDILKVLINDDRIKIHPLQLVDVTLSLSPSNKIKKNKLLKFLVENTPKDKKYNLFTLALKNSSVDLIDFTWNHFCGDIKQDVKSSTSFVENVLNECKESEKQKSQNKALIHLHKKLNSLIDETKLKNSLKSNKSRSVKIKMI